MKCWVIMNSNESFIAMPGTVNTGAINVLPAITDHYEKYGIWF